MGIELEDVRRLRLDPGDILVVRMPEHVTKEQVADVTELLKHHLPDHKVLAIGHDVDLGVVEAKLWPSS